MTNVVIVLFVAAEMERKCIDVGSHVLFEGDRNQIMSRERGQVVIVGWGPRYWRSSEKSWCNWALY